MGDNQVRLTERPVVGPFGVRHHEEYVGEPGSARVALSLDEGSRVGVETDYPPGSRREVKRKSPGPRPDVENGTTVEGLLIEPPDQRGGEGPVTPTIARRAPARLLHVPSHAGASIPSILRRESAPPMRDRTRTESDRATDALRSPVGEVARLFLKLGLIGFGGPAAHIALMEDDVVRRRRWLTREAFLDLLGATNLIPGPNSTEMAIHIGYLRAGWLGLIAGGACFILPAMMITLVLASAYTRYGRLPEAGWILYGVKPVIIAVVVQAVWGLARRAVATPLAAATALAVLVLALRGANEVGLLFAAALGLPLIRAVATAGSARALAPGGLLGLSLAATTGVSPVGVAAGGTALLPQLALIFLKVGSILFGSGYVLLAFLRPDLVERTRWLTDPQLLDAIAVGQFTPGPVLTTATFIGYLVAGGAGAVVATVAIFLPSFVFVALSSPFIPRLRESPLAAGFLDGANSASVALMATVTWELGRAAVVDWLTGGLALVAAAVLLTTRINSAWLVVGGAAVGAFSALFR